MNKQITVLIGAGSIGQAIIRRVSAGKHVVLADYSLENAERAARMLVDAGFECSAIGCDLGWKEDILSLVEFATSKGEVTRVVNAAGVSPSQAPVEEILRVRDIYMEMAEIIGIFEQPVPVEKTEEKTAEPELDRKSVV